MFLHTIEQLTNEEFLRYDSGVQKKKKNRILIFATDFALKYFAQSHIIADDGTFQTVSGIFYQLFTLHGVIIVHTCPLVYCVCSRKTEEIYYTVFDKIKNVCNVVILQ